MENSVFRSLDRKDVYLSEYVAKKQWSIWHSEFRNYGIGKITATSGSGVYYPKSTDLRYTYDWASSCTYYPRLAYEGFKNAFYEGSLKDGTFSGSRNLDLQSGVTVSGSRNIGENDLLIYSIPRDIIGDGVVPGTITFWCSSSAIEIKDVEGVLISGSQILGDVIYDKGLLIFTDSASVELLKGLTDEHLEYTSEVSIYTYNINCSIKDLDFNGTFNPTAVNLIGKPDFTPYVTSIGLYNNSNELVAVAKLSKPIKKASNVDTTFNVRIDIG